MARTGPAVVRFEANALGRDFAVGDIHGAFADLRRALDAIGFDEHRDRLFSVGDLVDRGPESEAALEWLDRPWFQAVCGNHDFMTWRSALGRPFAAVDHLAHGGQWLARLSPDAQKRMGERLAALPMVIEVETAAGLVGIVHADFPSDDWNDLAEFEWLDLDQMRSQTGQCLWSVDRYRYQYTGTVKNIRAVVHGHKTLPAMATLGNVFFIDTGGWQPTGRFTFLELGSLKAVTGPGSALSGALRNRYR